MKKVKKVLLLVLCAALLVGASVAGTLAYLTDTDNATNTFTVGKVEIELKEYQVDQQTGLKTDTEVDGLQDLELVPGRTIQKNPFVIVDANSETCWLFVKIENNLGNAVTINDLTGWTPVEGHDGYYQYYATVDAGATITVFQSITVAETSTYEELNGIDDKNIVITAYAVQAEGVTQQAAWGALDQHYVLN
jgi:predicted ribosomally synthesized peptide with SipW-like signal peptide